MSIFLRITFSDIFSRNFVKGLINLSALIIALGKNFSFQFSCESKASVTLDPTGILLSHRLLAVSTNCLPTF